MNFSSEIVSWSFRYFVEFNSRNSPSNDRPSYIQESHIIARSKDIHPIPLYPVVFDPIIYIQLMRTNMKRQAISSVKSRCPAGGQKPTYE